MSDLRDRRTTYARTLEMSARLVRSAPIITPATYPPRPQSARLVWFLQQVDRLLIRADQVLCVALKRSVSLTDTLTIFLLATLSGLTATLIRYILIVGVSEIVELLEMLA